MSENKITTSVQDVTFDDVIAEFDKEVSTESSPSFMAEQKESSTLGKTPEQIAAEDAAKKAKEEKEKAEKEKAEKEKAEAEKVAAGSEPVKTEVKKTEIKDIDSVLDREDDEEEETEEKNTSGATTVDAIKKLIEEGTLLPFDEDKDISEYTSEDITALLKANIEHNKQEALETEINEFFDSLPRELQYAAKYVADGGTDMKGLFRALAATEEIRDLDTSNGSGREAVIREYYRAIDWGTEEEISEEIERIREMGESEMEKTANKFKPKLEKMHEEVVKQQLSRQEKASQLAAQEMQNYLDNAHEAIKTGKLGSVQLDKKTQTSLWAGITQASHQTRRGTATNELGHLLEKYQYVEPNFELIYKVLWLLKDEKGYEEHIAKAAKNESASDTARVLKVAEQSKKTATGLIKEEKTNQTVKKTIKRPQTPSFLQGLK